MKKGGEPKKEGPEKKKVRKIKAGGGDNGMQLKL